MSGPVERLAAFLDLLVRTHPFAVRILTGEHVPTDGEIDELLDSLSSSEGGVVRIGSWVGKSTEQESRVARLERVQSVLAAGGGWTGIALATREFRELYAETWRIFTRHVTWIDAGGGSRIEQESALSRLALSFGVSPDTVRRKRSWTVYMIARGACMMNSVLL